MKCLDANTIVALAEGRVRDDERTLVVAHLDVCDECLALASDAARAVATPGAVTKTGGVGAGTGATGVASPLQRGDRLGRYTMLDVLGQGGMGTVFEAHDAQLDRRVALKLLRSDRVYGPGARDRVLREARAMAKVHHPNVVTVYDAGELDGILYIAMELVQGTTLAHWLREQPRGWRESLSILLAAGRGLAAAHAAGIVHGDFKPANVLLDGQGRVAVTDFGLASGRGGEPSAGGGTPGYMAPEQYLGIDVDARADQFSFAVSVHEALFGERPFAGSDLRELRDAVVRGRIRPVASDGGVPRGLGATLRRALDPRAEARYPTLEALITAIGRFAPSRSIPAARLLAIVVVVACVCALLAVAAWRRTHPATTAGLTPEAASVTLITELPMPSSGSPQALAAYRRGLEAQRAGSLLTERRELVAATDADPEMAQAWLRLALAEIWSREPTRAREDYRHAADLSAHLDAHDRALLEAAEPVIQRVPMDLAEHAGRLAAAVDRFPRDAELAGAYAYAVYRTGRWKDAIEAYDHAIALDPSQAEQFRFEALARSYLGDFDGARATADACEKACPSSGMCPMIRATLSEQTGDCRAEETEVRSMMLKGTVEGYDWFGDALASQNEPADAVLEAQRMRLQHIPPDAVALRTATNAVQLALWQGDFDAAERLSANVESVASEVPTEEEHAYAAGPTVLAYLESGRTGEARKAAEAFLARRPSWTVAGEYTLGGLRRTILPLMFEARLAGGAPASEVKAQRDAFLADWGSHLPAPHASNAWLATYAYVATPDEAREAMAALAEYSPLPVYRGETLWEAAEGHVRLLAGDVAGALPLLERGAGVCLALSHPVERVRAQLDLAEARAASGDREGACEAYAAVIARYGAAKPRSISGERAKSGAKSLGCTSLH